MPKKAKKNRLTPFRRRVLDKCRYDTATSLSRWIAEELHASETRVSNALCWLEKHGYQPRVQV